MTEATITLTDADATAKALRDTIRSAVNGLRKYADYVTAHNVTRDNVKDHALALAIYTYPNEKTVQTIKTEDGRKVRTKFGNAVQAAAKGLREALETDDDDTPKPAVLRVSLSGEGGGTVKVDPDHPLYDALIEMIQAESN